MQTQVTCAREAAYSSDNRVGSAYQNSIRGPAELQFIVCKNVDNGYNSHQSNINILG